MNKKKKKQLMKEIQENLKKEEENKEAARQVEKEKLRQKELLKEKLKIEIKEREIREEMLPKVCSFFEKISHTRFTEDICQREEQNWIMYLKCDGLPDPTNMDDMNYYLYKWQNEVESDIIDNTITKFDEVIKLLDLLDSYIEKPLLTPSNKVNLWKDIQQRFYTELLQRLDNATYNIICNVEKYMENVDNLSARLIKDSSYFALGLWTKYQVPEPCISLDDIDIDTPIVEFPDLSITVKPPYQLAFKNFVVRIVWFKYDQYSKTSRTCKAKSLPIEYTYDLNMYTINEFLAKEKLKQEYEDEKKKKKEKVKIKKSDKQVSRQSGGSVTLPIPRLSINKIRGSFQSESSSSFSSSRESRSSGLIQNTSVSDSRTSISKPSELFIVREETTKEYFEKYFTMKVDSVRKELNLRQYMVIGGVYNLDFLESLPQPVTLKNRTTLIISYGEHLIKHIPVDMGINYISRRSVKPWQEKFTSISQGQQIQGKEEVLLPDKSSLSQESKAESSRQSKHSTNWEQQEGKEENKGINEYILKENEECLSKDNNELEGKVEREPEIPSERYSIVEYDEIYFKPQITIKLPNNVLWFNPPFPVLWDYKNSFWTEDELDNVEFDNEQQILSFRLKKLLSPLGLAVKRYTHLPFTDWKMKANFSSGKLEYVNFTLISEKITVEFKIKQKEVCLNSLVTSLESQHIFKDIIGNYYRPNNLMQIMECRGLDIFSDHDTFLYVEGVMSKQWICESHTYKSISVLCATHNFSWSKWNRSVGSNCIVVNFQDLSLCPSGNDYSLVLITPEYASFLNCNEGASEFCSTPRPGQTFSPDLYTLAESVSSFMTLSKIKSPDFLLASTMYEMLSRTRVCSFS